MKDSPSAVSNEAYRSQALCRALDILDCFSLQNRELSLTDIVQRTGLNKTTVKRIVHNLTARNYLHQDPQTRRYRLGIRLFEMGGIVYSSFSLRKAAEPHLTRLRDATGLTIFMGIAVENKLVFVDKLGGTGVIQISSGVGFHTNLHFGMLGMVLMAYLPTHKVAEILKECPLKAYTPFSITDPQAFDLRLAEIRNQGFIVEREEAHEGLIGIAAPVRDYSRSVIAAVGISLPVSRNHGPKEIQQLVEKVKAATDAISSDLGYLKV